MQYRSYGRGGPMVSALGFGVMRLPPRRKDAWGTVNFARAVPVMRAAMDAGVNFFDSHHGYHNGLSEVAIGKALRGWRGRRIYVQTKTPYYKAEPQRYFQRLIEEALEKLGVGCIDYLLFHSMTMETFRRRGRGFLRLTDWAMKKGYVRQRGFSSHDTPEHVKAFIDTGEFSAMLVSYNWLNPKMADTIAYGAARGMGVSVMNPVGGGALSADTRPILRLLSGARSAAEVALRYVLDTRGVAVAVSGMNTLEQVAENARIASRKAAMTPRQRRAMRTRLAGVTRRAAAICTACGYCMPCPQGVNIPENFLLLSRAELFDLTDFARARFARLRKSKRGDQSALACRQCGACLPKCPSHVPIADQLARTARLLGG